MFVCAGDDSAAPSIYNSTDGNSDVSAIPNSIEDNPIEDDSPPSIYNSTGNNSAIDSSNNPITDETGEVVELVEYEKVPINEAYSRDKLQNINVSDSTLESFSRFGLWLEEQKVDAKAEDINVMYIDDDLRVIEGYWIFATRPESKERYIEIIQNSKSENASPDEMIAFLKNFDEKYPIKYVRIGLVLFVTVENKEVLLSEISETDTQMLENISNLILNELSIKGTEVITSNWGSSSPNMHADMSGWAAEKAGFDPYYVDIISSNAAEPDNVLHIDAADSLILKIIDELIYIKRKNYNHYYDPTFLYGGAPDCIEAEYNNILASGSNEEKYMHLSYSSHYMADLSMPLHTSHAGSQFVYEVIDEGTGLIKARLKMIEELDALEPHFAYENNYVGANWTTGHNFSRFAKDVNSGVLIYNPSQQSKDLAAYANLFADDAWDCGVALRNNLNYVPPSSVFYATAFRIDEGQRYLIGLMHHGYQVISSTSTTTSFTNQEDITLQLEEDGLRVQELELTNLRVSMGAGDSARLYLNGNEILKFVDSSAGGNLYIYNESGNQLGVISRINGKPAYENMTFDVSFIHDGSEMTIDIKKYDDGLLNSTFSYSYLTSSDISTMRANMTGYQSNVDYISSEYVVYYEP